MLVFYCCRCREPGCDYEGVSYSSLLTHRNTVHEGVRYACTHPECSYRATQRSNLKIHVALVHSDIKMPCTVDGCTFVAKIKSHLNVHMRDKHGVKRATGRPLGRRKGFRVKKYY